jgi:hypothetical protein
LFFGGGLASSRNHILSISEHKHSNNVRLDSPKNFLVPQKIRYCGYSDDNQEVSANRGKPRKFNLSFSLSAYY